MFDPPKQHTLQTRDNAEPVRAYLAVFDQFDKPGNRQSVQSVQQVIYCKL